MNKLLTLLVNFSYKQLHLFKQLRLKYHMIYVKRSIKKLNEIYPSLYFEPRIENDWQSNDIYIDYYTDLQEDYDNYFQIERDLISNMINICPNFCDWCFMLNYYKMEEKGIINFE